MIQFLPSKTIDKWLSEDKNYWKQKLPNSRMAYSVPLDFKRPASIKPEKKTVLLEIPIKAEKQLLTVCDNNPMLGFVVFVTALKIVLHKYTGHREITVGTSIHNRFKQTAVLNQILALNTSIAEGFTVKQLLNDVKTTLSEAYHHQKYPFDQIVEQQGIDALQNRSPLFDIVITMESINQKSHLKNLKNDISIHLGLERGHFKGRFEYNPNLFHPKTIEVFKDHFMIAVKAIIEKPNEKIANIGLLSAKKREAFTNADPDSLKDIRNKTINQLFAEQVEKTPQNIAVEYGNQGLTYDALNRRANQLAWALKRIGIEPSTRVGIFLEHSLETIVAILGTLKIGAIYVPLDPKHPSGKIAHILKDAGISIVLTQDSLAPLVSENHRAFCMDSDFGNDDEENDQMTPLSVNPSDLAYLIYTSGSTGQPKGVCISHGSLSHYIQWANNVYVRGETLAFPLYSSLAFDLTVTSIFTPLISGNKIIIYRESNRQPALFDILKDNQIGVLKLTPSHLSLIKDQDNRSSRIRRFIVGGEAFDRELAEKIHLSFDEKVEIYNEYGPTEATIGCMIHRFDPIKDRQPFVPIGTARDGSRIYILDEQCNPVAENMRGEMYISGAGVAEGYWNQASLTVEKFLNDPFVPEQTMYKTGDMARWLPTGGMEFLGRMDSQVKFHGFRVELEEIQIQLKQHPLIRDGAVMIRKNKKNHDIMIAYYASRQPIESERLRAFLAENIIEETIPNFFVHLKRLPLTINGKINYQGLPDLDEVMQLANQDYIAPETETEIQLSKIWGDVLGLDKISMNHKFFDIGGQSLSATQVVTRIRNVLNVELPLAILFEIPTIAGLAQEVEARLQKGTESTAMDVIEKVNSDSQSMIADIESLSDEEVDAYLQTMLNEKGDNV